MRRLALLALVATLACGDDDTSTTDAGRDAGAVMDVGTDAGSEGTDTGPDDIDAAAMGDTWESWANEFVQTYCVECHARSPRDFHMLEEVRANAAVARCGVSDVPLDDCSGWPPPRQFPVGDGPFPSDEERARFVRWVDDGAP